MTDLDLDIHSGQPARAWHLPSNNRADAASRTKAADEWSPRRRLAVFLLCALGSWAVVLVPVLLYWYA